MMTTDHATDVQSVRDIIREFLSLPSEAMPSAISVDDDCEPWAAIRDYLLPEDVQEYSHCGEEIRLHADRAGWENVRITLE